MGIGADAEPPPQQEVGEELEVAREPGVRDRGQEVTDPPEGLGVAVDLEVAVGELHLGEPLGHDHAVTQGVELRAGVIAAVANVLERDRVGFRRGRVEVDPDVFRANNDAHMVPFTVLKPLKKPTEPEPTAHQYNVAGLHFGCDLLVRGQLRAHGRSSCSGPEANRSVPSTQAVSTPEVGMSATQKTRKRTETGQRFGPDELQQVIDGAAFLGSGGGGSIAVAKELRRVILELTDKRGVMVTPVAAVGAKETRRSPPTSAPRTPTFRSRRSRRSTC